MLLPESNELPVDRLSSVFTDTTNSYKFYWFLAILNHLKENGSSLIALDDLALRMVAQVWYPLDYFRLSFGRQDSFKHIAHFVSQRMTVDNGPTAPGLFEQIRTKLSAEDQKTLKAEVTRVLLRWVPYRFVRPFFAEELRGIADHQINHQLVILSNERFTLDPRRTLYRFINNAIELNPLWVDYFLRHQTILRGFINWHLVKFLQKNNPNVIGLSEKLERPVQRNLKLATDFWQTYLKGTPELRCIYSGQQVTRQNFSLDHFLPWSFVAHDQLWNIIPTPKSVNSSKSDWLPSTELYMDAFANIQYQVFHYHYAQSQERLLEDYSALFANSLEDVAQLETDSFVSQLRGQLLPQLQVARNLGFPYPFEYKVGGSQLLE
ncbi:HNH endonuclease domain-containing protein [Nibrella saemangeumensis]|uniref:HNH endonuclease domain-containing protein n=1 Tax=Nibrella saemangeumensis TaxID=1084526 RepID=A0ABP8N932_9BACT